jgi:hypothetical protein
MVIALLVGLVVGFVLAMPPGPIAIAIIRQALAGHEQDNSAILPSELPICKSLYDKSLSGRITHSLL